MNQIQEEAIRYARAQDVITRVRKMHESGLITADQFIMLRRLAIDEGPQAARRRLGDIWSESQKKNR